jgi:hypothetical protein
MRLLGSIATKDPFQSIAWGVKGVEEARELRYGLVAGGMADGSLALFNVDAVIAYVPLPVVHHRCHSLFILTCSNQIDQ